MEYKRMKKIGLCIVFIFFCFAFCQADDAIFEKEVSLVKTIQNFHFVAPGVIRGSQPDNSGFDILKRYCGIKTVLDLCNVEEDISWEKPLVEGLGMKFINIPLSWSQELSPEKIASIIGKVHNKSDHPIFVHCYTGKDRTGLVMAAYRIKYEGWEYKDALQEMLAYGFSRSRCINLEKSLERWYEWEKGGR